MKKEMISDRQFFVIIFVAILSLTFFSVPAMLIPAVKQDLWLSMLLGTVVDIYVAYLLFWMGRAYPGQSLIQYSVSILGKIGNVAAAVFLVFFLIVIWFSLYIFVNFLSSTLMMGTPVLVLNLTMVVAAGWAAYHGIETIARLAEMIAVLIFIVSILGLLLSVTEMDLGELLPQFENGIWPAVRASVYPSSWFGVCILMGMVMPHHQSPHRTFKVKVSAVVLGSAIITAWLLNSVVTLGQEAVGRLYYPIYGFSRTIRPVFFERMDILTMLVYILGTFITIAILYFNLTEGASQLFRTRPQKRVRWIWAFGVLFVILPILPPLGRNTIDSFDILEYGFPLYALAVEGGLTTLLFAAALIRKRRRPARRRGS
ncbi:GerAB/ArcD/ProY family transporter [Paenibacillus humicola]|uniref:GerAB/ArcD/ProY family transporter n=1 Tax=Paenibacillus humicola TaxID=3110540 RepID=UPI00237AA943|nr:endospore germination permease [Paenibacillus humicola]